MFASEYIRSVISLEGRRALVTGGNQGIGRAIAISLASFGAAVTIIGRNLETLEKTMALLPGEGHEMAQCDVSNRGEIDEFFASYKERHTGLDIYINNAAYSVHSTMDEAKSEDVDGLLDTNLKGAIHFLQHAATIMKAQRSGSIVIITSVNALNPHPTQAMYSVTKYGLEAVAKSLASALGPYNIRVNTCAPGAIDTPINAEAFSTPGFVEAFSKRVSLKRIGTVEEIGDAVALLAGDAFRYMTGATVVIDGGLMLKQV